MTARTSDRLRPIGLAYVWSQLLPALLLIAFLIGALLFSGGQVGAGQSPNWDVVIPFPVFPVPAWLLIGFGGVGVLLAAVWAVRSRDDEALALSGALGVTIAACVASMFFGLAFLGDAALAGPFWAGMVLAAVSATILTITAAVRGRRARSVGSPTEAPS